MITTLVLAGLLALRDYVATHVLTCLVPAFLLAGAMVAFIRREAVLEILGEKANRIRSFSLASLSSFLLAACSCTVIPVAGGLFYSGAGVGPAFILLWVAPAANILALVYTGNILGLDMVAARVGAALLMAFVVGLVMSAVFGREVRELPDASPAPPGRGGVIERRFLVLVVLLLLSLLLPNYVVQRGPYAVKVAVWAAATLAVAGYTWRAIPRPKTVEWLRESWWFVRIMFPLLLVGVFLVGVVGAVIPENVVKNWVGGSGLGPSFLATMFGAVAYFATMTEAPFVDTLMKLGMGKGPALALLLTGPGLSLPSWLAIARVFGVKKALVYIPTIVVLGTLVGWAFGNFVF